MEAFEIAYDDETKQWIKRPCASRPRIVGVPRPPRRLAECAIATVITLQVIVGLWLVAKWRG